MITNRDINWVRTDELYHHGIKGQKWGVRRYQNSDGTLTSAGKAHKKGVIILESDGKSTFQRWKEKRNPEAARNKRIEENTPRKERHIRGYDEIISEYDHIRKETTKAFHNASSTDERIRMAVNHYESVSQAKNAHKAQNEVHKLDPGDENFSSKIRSVTYTYAQSAKPPTRQVWESNIREMYEEANVKPNKQVMRECSYENFKTYMNKNYPYSKFNPSYDERNEDYMSGYKGGNKKAGMFDGGFERRSLDRKNLRDESPNPTPEQYRKFHNNFSSSASSNNGRYGNSSLFDDFDGDWTKIASDVGYNYKGSSRVKHRR